MSILPLALYRGQLHTEWSRISFLLEAVVRAHGGVALAYLAPRGGTAREAVEAALAEVKGAQLAAYLDGRLPAVPSAMRELRRLRRRHGAVLAIGSTSICFARLCTRRVPVWFVNGIPEERLLVSDGAIERAGVRLLWRAARASGPVDLAVVVSHPMAELVAHRCRPGATFVAPCCVETSSFAAGGTERRFVTYLGSGAPWQGLENLSRIWAAMHERDPSLRFRAISREPAVTVLGTGLPRGVFEHRAAEHPGDVAAWLSEASLGCLVRERSIVNEVAFPMKLGEYLAAGVPVLASSIGWDVETLLGQSGAGIVVDGGDAGAVADAAVSFLRCPPADLAGRVEAGARLVDRGVWVERLGAALTGGASRTAAGAPIRPDR